MSTTAKQKKHPKVAEASANYLIEPQQIRHSGENRNLATSSVGWRWSTLGEVAEIVGGGTPKTDRADYFGGEIPWITPADLSGYTEKFISRGARNITQAGLEKSGARLMPSGAVLFSSRAPIGYVAIAANPVSTNQGFKSFVLRDAVTPDYVYYYLQHAKKLAVELASGTTFLEISGKKVAQIPIPVPPLEVQHHIVAEIEKQFTRLEAGIAALRRVQADLKRYRAAVLKAACEGRLVPTEAELARKDGRAYESADRLLARILNERREKWVGRGNYEAPTAPRTAALLPLPEGWVWASVEQVSTKVVDGVHKKPNYVRTGIPFVTVRNLTAGPGISFEKLNYITQADHAEFSKRANPKRGDILVSKDGTLGVIRVINTDIEFSIFVSVALVKPVIRQMTGFLATALSSPQVQAQMVPKGSGLQHIHLEDLREDCIPLPPCAEQTRIVAEVERLLSVTEEQEAVVLANLQRASRLRQVVLQRVFSP